MRLKTPLWRPAMRRIFRKILAVFLLGVGVVAAWYLLADRPLYPGRQVFHLPAGTTMHEFADILQRRHIIDFADPFIALAKLEGDGSALKAGDYRFPATTTPLAILHRVVDGRVIEYPFTFIPGWTFHQIRAAFSKAPHLRDNVQGLSHSAIRAALHEKMSLEGSFLPNTYFYTNGATALSLLRRAHRQLRIALARAWMQRAPDLPLRTPQQALILASLIEKETAKAGERRKIAGVFVNRLRLGMRLETDPTVIYSLGRAYHGVLTAADLAFKSPYNTYLHYGLPPTPIGLCSLRALHAALHPAKTRALYFVATGQGGHVFSDTLQAQDREIRKYELDGHQ